MPKTTAEEMRAIIIFNYDVVITDLSYIFGLTEMIARRCENDKDITEICQTILQQATETGGNVSIMSAATRLYDFTERKRP